MNKKELIQTFTLRLENDLQSMTEAAKNTLDAATNEESKAENQYDTRGLEASYLAGAQAKRVKEIAEVLDLFKSLTFRDLTSSDPVQSTALVTVLLDGKKNTLLMMPKGGGVQLSLNDNEVVQIVTPASSLGESILTLKVGETVEFEVGTKTRECKILSIK
jgi:transcription elongation GreA/GreB family factor